METHTINYHLRKLFSDGEIEENSVIRKIRITAADRKTYNTNDYNLSAILAVGNKVDFPRIVQSRKWANQIIEEISLKWGKCPFFATAESSQTENIIEQTGTKTI